MSGFRGPTLCRVTCALAPATRRNNLGEAYQSAGRLSEAIALHEATLKLLESNLGPDPPDTLASRNNLASAYESLGRWADSEALRRDGLTLRRKSDKPNSPDFAGALASLGLNL